MNITKTVAIGLCAVVFGLVPVAANAQYDDYTYSGGFDYGSDFGGGYDDYTYSGGFDYGSDFGGGYDDYTYSGGFDYGSSYDYSGYDDYTYSGGFDYGSDFAGSYDPYTYSGDFDWGTNFSPDGTTNFSPDGYTNFSPDGYTNFSPDDCGSSCYEYSEACACYQPTGQNTYSERYAQAPRFTPPSYVPPRVTPITPSYPVYPQPPVRPQPQPPVYVPQQPNVTNTNINTNTCTNNSCNTNVNNIDNSINGSFNTATVVPVTPQPIIQYQIPQYPVQNQGLYCLISASQNSIQSGQTTYLAWSSSYGAVSATLSEAGNVPTTGTYAVRPLTTRMYTLTVYGQNGQTASCNVMVNVNNAAPYVSLSQIPYTGIDFDIMGSAVYWATLLSLAIAGAYLVVYYKGGALSLAGLTLAGAMNRSNNHQSEPVILSETVVPQEEQVAEEVVVEESKVDAFAHLPVMTDRSTKDTMAIAHTGGVPRIVIARA